ncbi:mechanosensitive ion channel family protein [Prosthecomicrobium sp. N25]|uniref:mechanosensitive ion channel family protein n=1 Tax=Prosthecomicrobium sp. N25 TaxID=3129254 RepID=UPI0030785212
MNVPSCGASPRIAPPKRARPATARDAGTGIRFWRDALVAALLFGLAALLAPAPGAAAGAATAAPQAAGTGLSDKQFDLLVDRVSRAMAGRLAGDAGAEGEAAKAGTTDPAKLQALEDARYERISRFVRSAAAAVTALPDLGAVYGSIPGRLDERARGGSGVGAYLLLLAFAVAVSFLAERLVRAGLAAAAARFMPPGTGAGRLVLARLAMDIAAVAALWIVSQGAIGTFFPGKTPQDRLAAGVLETLLQWRIVAMVFRVILRPGIPVARIAPLGDADASRLYRLISAVALGLSVLQLLYLVTAAIETRPEVLAAARLLNGLVAFGLLQWCLHANRAEIGRWFAGLAASDRVGASVGRFLADHWFAIGQATLAVLLIAQIHGAVTRVATAGRVLVMTLAILVGLVLFETLLRWVLRRSVASRAREAARAAAIAAAAARSEAPRTDAVARAEASDALDMPYPLPGQSAEQLFTLETELPPEVPPPAPATPEAVAEAVLALPLKMAVAIRCLRVVVYITAGIVIAQAWVVDVLALVDRSAWLGVLRACTTSGFVLAGGYLIWEIVEYFSARYRRSPMLMPGVDEDVALAPPSRMATLMPLLRVAIYIFTIVVGLLLILSELGVNTTPLIAGASVAGLAISFGSQSLVKDVVSGVFFLADDAFRVGEYIECGHAKGTVEGFTVRSLRLRHQNGMVHTIPYGQLGLVTNYSRDWTTVKFNLRMARSTDLEKLRKTTKKVGIALADDPAFKGQFISPLKLQGVADVAENALIVRFKFTARPGTPSLIQREGLKRLYKAFQENGIEFASATVTVQSSTGGIDTSTAAAGAAARAAAASALPAA